MPTYEYECPTCGVFEVDQRITEDALTVCPICKEKGKKQKIMRIISAPAFHLKGGGWYKDLYSSTKKDSGSNAASADSGGSSNGNSGVSSTSDSSSTSPAPHTATPSKSDSTPSAGSSDLKSSTSAPSPASAKAENKPTKNKDAK